MTSTAFGNKIYSSETTPNNYLYRGEQFDSDLGMYYLRARTTGLPKETTVSYNKPRLHKVGGHVGELMSTNSDISDAVPLLNCVGK